MGQTFVKHQSSSKANWKIISKLINKGNIPRIPPILCKNKCVVNCKENACLMSFANNSIPSEYISYQTENKLTTIVFSNDDILSIRRLINPTSDRGLNPCRDGKIS